MIKGKQIEDSSISKSKLDLTSPTLGKDPVTKNYLEGITVNGKPLSGAVTLTKADIGLTFVDDVPDASKPVSTAQRIAINEKLSYYSISDFRASFDSNLDSVFITDLNKAGLFKYDSTSSLTDDGVMTLVKNGKRYLRQYDGEINIRWFGAVGDNVVNDAPAIIAANSAALSRKSALYIPRGTYYIAAPVTLNVDSHGEGVIRTGSGAQVSAGSNIKLRINIDGANAGGTIVGKGLYLNGASNVIITDSVIKNTSGPNLWCSGSNNLIIIGNRFTTARGNFADGVYIAGSSNTTVSFNTISDFNRIGIAFEQNGTTGCYNGTAIGNHVFSAFETSNHTLYTNGGIWMENIWGAIISDNIVEDTYDRGIVITPSVDSGIKYNYTVSNNHIRNALRGIAFVYAVNQSAVIDNNTITDCAIGIECGDFDELTISNCRWKLKDLTSTSEAVRYVPTVTSGRKSNIIIRNCENYANTINPFYIADDFGHNGDITLIDNKGNWSYSLGSRTLNGNLYVDNTTLDFSGKTSGFYLSNNISATFKNSTITLPTTQTVNLTGSEVTFDNTILTAPSLTRITVGQFGFNTLNVINNSKFNYIYLYDVRKTNTVIKFLNSEFDNYHLTTGVFNYTVAQIASVEVRGCKFSETILAVPINFSSGVAKSIIGNNVYWANNVVIGFIPTVEAVSFMRGTTVQRPVSPVLGYEYLDITIGKMIYWNGTEWMVVSTPPTYTVNTATTAPTKSSLNTTYGSYKAGSVLYYGSVTSGGGRDYTKLTDSVTSDWLQTLWSDGVKSIIA